MLLIIKNTTAPLIKKNEITFRMRSILSTLENKGSYDYCGLFYC